MEIKAAPAEIASDAGLRTDYYKAQALQAVAYCLDAAQLGAEDRARIAAEIAAVVTAAPEAPKASMAALPGEAGV